jgi:hypothetical protein
VATVAEDGTDGVAAAICSLGCNCSGVGRETVDDELVVPLPAVEIVTLTVMGFGVAVGLVKLMLPSKTAVHWSCNQASMAAAPVLSLSL